MTSNRTLRKLDIQHRKRAPQPDAPDHQLQRIKNLAKNEISKPLKNTQKPLVMDDEVRTDNFLLWPPLPILRKRGVTSLICSSFVSKL